MATETGPGLDPGLGTWPFWAPSRAEAVAAALDLAGVGPGVRLVDLGCGDGQVLAAAAARGDTVAGLEADSDLASTARDNLAGQGVEADVAVADLLDPAVDLGPEPSVLFAYLAPATLQRLLPTLARRRDQLVTVDFAVPGRVATRRDGPARLYRLPGRRRPVPAPGWPSAGSLIAVSGGTQSLSCLESVHPGGRVRMRTSPELSGCVAVATGADDLDQAAHLAVDLRWEELEAGTVVDGWIEVSGVGRHGLVLVVTEDEDEMWELTDDGLRGIRRALRRDDPPTSTRALLDAARS